MAKILRLTKLTMTAPDGTRVPKTTVNWIDEDGTARVSLLDGHVEAAEAQYQVGVL